VCGAAQSRREDGVLILSALQLPPEAGLLTLVSRPQRAQPPPLLVSNVDSAASVAGALVFLWLAGWMGWLFYVAGQGGGASCSGKASCLVNWCVCVCVVGVCQCLSGEISALHRPAASGSDVRPLLAARPAGGVSSEAPRWVIDGAAGRSKNQPQVWLGRCPTVECWLSYRAWLQAREGSKPLSICRA
jgi:hypothetical protein